MSFEQTVLDSKRKTPVESSDNPGELTQSRRGDKIQGEQTNEFG